MKTSRREFIKTSTLAVAGSALLAGTSCKGVEKQKLVTSVQLYGVREEMKNAPAGTLAGLAKMGYTHVEHANYVQQKFYGWNSAEFRKRLDDLGLKMLSGHTVLGKNHWDNQKKDFTDEWKKTVEDAAFMGQKFVVSPWLDESLRQTYDGLMEFMEVFNRCGELCQKSGMKFGYHNHHFEFTSEFNGEKIFDLMMKNTDPDKVVIQLDMGNMFIAGALARDVISKYPGRYDTIHVKDIIKTGDTGEKFESTVIGKGLVGSREATDLAKASGSTLFVIEQESYQGKTPMECMEKNLSIMKSWGYA